MLAALAATLALSAATCPTVTTLGNLNLTEFTKNTWCALAALGLVHTCAAVADRINA